ncbi:ankyrin, partial [Coprinopsis marcescibilis]
MGGAKHVAAAHGIEEYFSLPSSALEVSNLADEVAGTTPLILALRFWHVNLAAMLLTLGGINLNARDVRGPDWTALMYAADQGYDAVVRILLTYDNIDINTTSATGNTPLILAAKGGHESVVALLCKVQGINVNSTNQAGKTALTLASRFGHVGIVKLLLD